MSDNNPSRPLTRREMREREQAAAAAQSAPAGQGWSAPPAGPDYGRPAAERSPYGAPAASSPPPPASRFAAPASAPSRRSLREQNPAAAAPAPAPMVRPPSASAGVRGLDETGRLAPIQRPTGEMSRAVAPAPTTVRPAAPSAPAAPSPAPTRTSMRRDYGAPSAGAPAAAAGPSLPPLAAPRSQAAPTAPPAATPPASVAPRPDGPPRRSPFSTTGSDSPFGTTAAAPAAMSAPAAAPSAPASTPPGSSAPPLPWATTTTDRPASVPPSRTSVGAPAASSPAPERPAASPFDALVASEQPVRARAAAPQLEEDDEEDWDEPEASYTWLHYIVLVVVAFVLGLLLWKLLLGQGKDQDFTTDAAAPAAVVSLTYEHPGVAA